MNNKRRTKLKEVICMLEKIENIVSDVLDAEQDCLDNIPENLQSGDRYECIEEAINNLEDATRQIGEIKDSIEEAAR